jgi:iron-regulated transporter 1
MPPLLGSGTRMGDDRSPLLTTSPNPASIVPDDASTVSSTDEAQACQVPAGITRRLYTSHFLSTWNTRVFEFGAVLYLASIFPGTFLPMSVYALTRGTSAILFSPAVGRYIDTGNRLQVVRLSIGKGAPGLF